MTCLMALKQICQYFLLFTMKLMLFIIFQVILHQFIKLTDAIWLLQLAISSALIHALSDPSQAPTGIWIQIPRLRGRWLLATELSLPLKYFKIFFCQLNFADIGSLANIPKLDRKHKFVEVQYRHLHWKKWCKLWVWDIYHLVNMWQNV